MLFEYSINNCTCTIEIYNCNVRVVNRKCFHVQQIRWLKVALLIVLSVIKFVFFVSVSVHTVQQWCPKLDFWLLHWPFCVLFTTLKQVQQLHLQQQHQQHHHQIQNLVSKSDLKYYSSDCWMCVLSCLVWCDLNVNLKRTKIEVNLFAFILQDV